jgi:hypothetical protein
VVQGNFPDSRGPFWSPEILADYFFNFPKRISLTVVRLSFQILLKPTDCAMDGRIEQFSRQQITVQVLSPKQQG